MNNNLKRKEKIRRFCGREVRELKGFLLHPIDTIVAIKRYLIHPEKNVVLLLSSMRSGSTLLKALLAEASDVSNLPEIDFREKYHNKFILYRYALDISDKNIVVFKKPQGFSYRENIWLIPKMRNVKVIVLIRDCASVVRSIKKMVQNPDVPIQHKTYQDIDLINYWIDCYNTLLHSVRRVPINNVCFVYYENLLNDPKSVTKNLFNFIGSSKKEGVDSYSNPVDFEWKWGCDDGSEVIRSLKVQKKRLGNGNINDDLNKLINTYDRAVEFKKRMNDFAGKYKKY